MAADGMQWGIMKTS